MLKIFTIQVIASVLVLIMTACSAEHVVQMRGPISNANVNSIISQTIGPDFSKEDTTLIIGDSPGGDAKSLMRLVAISQEKIGKIYLAGECLSACAEFLALSGIPIELSNKAYIGYHIGPILAANIAHNFTKGGDYRCLDKQASLARLFAKRVKWNADNAAAQTNKILIFYSAVLSDWGSGESCNSIKALSKVRYWFPTREELKLVFSLKFYSKKKEFCNESIKCLSSSLSKKWRGINLVVVNGKKVFLDKHSHH